MVVPPDGSFQVRHFRNRFANFCIVGTACAKETSLNEATLTQLTPKWSSAWLPWLKHFTAAIQSPNEKKLYTLENKTQLETICLPAVERIVHQFAYLGWMFAWSSVQKALLPDSKTLDPFWVTQTTEVKQLSCQIMNKPLRRLWQLQYLEVPWESFDAVVSKTAVTLLDTHVAGSWPAKHFFSFTPQDGCWECKQKYQSGIFFSKDTAKSPILSSACSSTFITDWLNR